MNMMVKYCPNCNGLGKQTNWNLVSLNEISGTLEEVEVECEACKGKGYIDYAVFSREEATAILEYCNLNKDKPGDEAMKKFYIDGKLLDKEILAAIESAYNDYENGEIVEAKRTFKAIIKAIEAFERNYEG